MARWSRRRALSAITLAPAIGIAPAILGCEGKGTAIARPDTRKGREGLVAVNGRLRARAAQDGDGADLHRLFPAESMRHLDPFVLFDDFDVAAPAGFPEHPHRGFEAFTYMIAGAFHHTDNLGNDSEIAAGGTQRFNSGKGARHSEMPGNQASNRGMQLWVNLAAEKKQMNPEYEGIAQMPIATKGDHRIRYVSGPDAPTRLHTEVTILDVEWLADATFMHEVPMHHTGLLYVLDGDVSLADEKVAARGAAITSGGTAMVTAAAGSRMLLLSGKPHGQPIRQRGPFVD
jgi:hypothetical protein